MSALLFGLASGLLLGILTARASNRRQPVRAGWLAHLFHYIGASSLTGAFPVGLFSVLLGGGAAQAVLLSISFVVWGLVCLFIYAAVEVLTTTE